MYRVFQRYIDGLIESSDECGLLATMEEPSAALDLSCFAYLALSASGPRREVRLISNYPTAWTDHYLQSRYDRLDPVISQAIASYEPFQWGPTTKGLSKQQLDLFHQASCFGIRYGYTVPIHDDRGPIAAFTFASQEKGPAFERCIASHGRVLQLMALYFHAHARRKIISDRHVDGITLSPREIECLEWAAQGKSAWDVSIILGIKRRTVAFHLNNAKAKLGVRTIQQATARISAAKMNTD